MPYETTEFYSGPGVTPSPVKKSYAVSGVMTECGLADDGNFQRCRWCPNASGDCANLIFDSFCYCIDAQREAK
jgi:hypothetical protein